MCNIVIPWIIMHMLQYTDSSALDDTFIVFGWHFHGKCIERQRRIRALSLSDHSTFILIPSLTFIYDSSEAEVICVVVHVATGRKFRGKNGRRGEGWEGAGFGWRRSGCGDWKRKEKDGVMDEGGVARNFVRVRRAYITAPSIYTDELQTLTLRKRLQRLGDRRVYILYYVDPCTIHPRTCSASLLQSTPLPAGYAKNGALVSGIVHSATARRLLLLLLMHDHCKAWFSVPNSFLKDIANYTHAHTTLFTTTKMT